jgi:hypothetical protein
MKRDTLVQKLMVDLHEGRVTVVTGTGVSVAATNNQEIEGYQVGTWPGLLLHGVQHCSQIGLVDEFDVNVLTMQINSGRTDHIISAAETITNKMRTRSPGVYRGWLKSTIGALAITNASVIDAIGRIPGVIATLNYDTLIEDHTGRRAITWMKSDEVEEVLNGRYDDSVIHLHGWYREPESVVLGTSSYLSVKDHPHARSVLQHFTIGRTLLFVGCGATFEDPNFTQLIQWGKEAIADVAPRHYVLCRLSELTQLQSALAAAPWLQPLAYGETYDELVPFLQSLVIAKPGKKKRKLTELDLDLDAYRKAMLTRYKRLKIEQLDPTTHDIRPLTLNAMYIDQHAKECTAIVPRVFELPKELQHQLRGKGELEGTEFDDATLAQYRRAYLDVAPRLVSDILADATCSKVVILGDPGSGKSTLLQHVLLQWAEENTVDANSKILPLLIELREFARFAKQTDSDNFLAYLQDGVGVRWHLDQNALRRRLAEHRSLVLFDGLDEIFDLAQRKEITTSIHRFAHEFPFARVVVTSRIVGYQHQGWNDEGFRQFMLQDLDQEQIGTFLQRWHMAAYEEVEDGDKKRLLLKRAIDESAAIRQLAGNPLLLTMMAVLNRTQDLPRDRAELYEQCARLLLHQWKVDVAFQTDPDLANASLDFKDKRGLLLRVARAMHSGERGLAGNLIDEEILESTLAAGLNEIRVSLPTRAARSLIEQLRGRNFMLCFMGGGTYAFVHRTFLEYFCAVEIRERFEKERSLSLEQLQSDIFGRWADETWHEVLCLLAGMISAKFAEQVVQWLMKQPDPNNTRHHFFVALRCLSEVRNRTAIAETEKVLRRIAKNLSIFEPPFPAQPWTSEGYALSEIRERALRMISTVWPDGSDSCRWFKHIVLSDGSWHIPELAARLLVQGWRDDSETLVWLKEQARSKRSARARSAIIGELVRGWPGDPEVLSIIATIFQESKDESIRGTALKSLAVMRGKNSESFEHLITVARNDDSYYVSYVAMQELIERWADSSDVLSTVWSMVKTGNRKQRHLALQTLMLNWGAQPEVLEFFQDLIDNEKDETILSFAYILMFNTWPGQDFVARLARQVAMAKGDSHVRQRAIDFLVTERRIEPQTLETVMICAKTNSPESLRTHAVGKLGLWSDNAVVLSCLKELATSKQSASVRRAALRSLAYGWGQMEEIGELLLSIAKNDISVELRKAAVDEVVGLDSKRVNKVTFLKGLMVEPGTSVEVRACVVKGFSQFVNSDAEIYAMVLSALNSNQASQVRLEALRVLINTCSANSTCLPLLKKISVTDRSADVRLPAVAELSRRSGEDSDIYQVLKSVAKNDRSKAVRVRAIRELARGWPAEAEVSHLIAERKRSDSSKEVREVASAELSYMPLLA